MKSGFILIDKPAGMTSRDVVNVICKKFNTRKVGHTGTLDPLATGLMILCINKATGLVDLVLSEDKEYLAKVKLGILTDTLDITGNVIKESSHYNINFDDLNKVLQTFIGTYMQEVPLYSAIKVNGKRLYDYAREHKDVVLPKREVSIKNIELLELRKDSFTFKICVSKGTYIRSLIRDIGEKMNVYMTMEELKRTKINNYDISEAKTLDLVSEEDIIPVSDFLSIPHVYVNDTLMKKVINGVRLKNIYNSDMVMFFHENNKLLAIYKSNDKNELCMFKLC